MNDALDTMEIVLNINDPNLGLKQGILTTIITIGAAFGTFITFIIIKNTPRRRFLHIIDVIQISGSVLSIVADFRVMLIARFIQGISCGMNSIVAPVFLKEMSPPEIYPLFGGISLILYAYSNITQLWDRNRNLQFYRYFPTNCIERGLSRTLFVEDIFSSSIGIFLASIAVHRIYLQI